MVRIIPCVCLLLLACNEAGDESNADAAETRAVDPCRETTSCRVFGKCTSILGVCQAATDSDCAGSENCLEAGECKAGDLPYDDTQKVGTQAPHRACWKPAERDEDCSAEAPDGSSQCADAGRGTALHGICAAGGRSDCEQSEACKRWGACAYKNGECWRGADQDEDCRTPFGENREHGCGNFGFCKATDGVCMTGRDEDCEDTFVCRTWGECKAYDGECWQEAKAR